MPSGSRLCASLNKNRRRALRATKYADRPARSRAKRRQSATLRRRIVVKSVLLRTKNAFTHTLQNVFTRISRSIFAHAAKQALLARLNLKPPAMRLCAPSSFTLQSIKFRCSKKGLQPLALAGSDLSCEPSIKSTKRRFRSVKTATFRPRQGVSA